MRSEGVGPVTYGQLLRRHRHAGEALDALAARGKPVADAGMAEAEMASAMALGARHVFVGEADYPPLLAELADPPPVLVAVGDLALARRPLVSIVGARNASAAGRGLARDMARALAEAGWVVASGLARGIDAAAHEGALANGTIACVAGGVDIAYPPENAQLQNAIAEHGLLLSELPPGTEPQARHFPRRNRLIAGVARGLVVVEAAPGSGSLITARLAAEAGREVMAVPGHPFDPRSRGGNGLIRDGAVLVESAADVLDALSPFQLALAPRPAPAARPAMSAEPARGMSAVPARGVAAPAAIAADRLPEDGPDALLSLLTPSGIAVDEIVRALGLPAGAVQGLLSDLELDGRVIRLAGGRVALAA